MMKYKNGCEIKLGDYVKLGGGITGVVVGCIETKQFMQGYEPDEWAYLGCGILVYSVEAGLFYYDKVTHNLEPMS